MSARIICAVSERDVAVKETVTLAADLAVRQGLPLEVVDVEAPVPPPVVAASAPAVVPPALELDGDHLQAAVMTEAARRREALEDLARDAGAEDITTETFVATPVEALRDLSSRPDAHMVVARDRGDGPLRSKLTGNPTREALGGLGCPLAILPPGVEGRLRKTPRLLCAVDDDEVAVNVAAFAGIVARRLDAPLHVVHSGVASTARQFARLRARCRSVMPPGVDVMFEVIPGPAVRQVPAEAERGSVDLAIIGAPRHGALGSAVRGSVAHALIDRATAPVVIVPDAVTATGL